MEILAFKEVPEIVMILVDRGIELLLMRQLKESEKERKEKNSHTGNRTRIGRVRACYPNQLDYMGLVFFPSQPYSKHTSLPTSLKSLASPNSPKSHLLLKNQRE